MKILSIVFAAVLSATHVVAQTADAALEGIVRSPGFKNATAFIESDHDRFVRELILLTEIPAPPFKEQKRAAAYLEMLRDRKSTRLNSSHIQKSRMPSSA